MKDEKNMYQRKTIHEKTRRIIRYSFKMGVLNEKRWKKDVFENKTEIIQKKINKLCV